MPITRRLALSGAALATSVVGAQAQTGGWPDRPLRIIVPFGPGGGNDILARAYGQAIGTRLGQTIVIENRPGAGGAVGAEAAIRSRPDGYTYVVHPSGPVLANPGQDAPAYDLARDLAPIDILGTFPAFIMVKPDSPHRNLAELIAWERANPGRGQYATGGITFQIWMEALNLRAKTKFEAVFYRGSIDSINAAAAGDVPAAVADPGPSLPQIKGGRVRALTVSTPSRIAEFPEIPTIAEAGFPGLEQISWIGLFAPAGTPEPIVTRMQALIAEVAPSPDVRERLAPLGMGNTPIGTNAYRETIQREIKLWQDIADAAGIKLSPMSRSTSTAFLEALTEAGVEFVFANFGSDHPAMVEAFAEARVSGRVVPRLITCPNEMVALSCAQGHAQVSGRAQAVVVHVECGTQALAGAVHNVAKGRAPVLIFAGLSPYTQQGELPGSRNEFIQWIQDVPDQRGIVRGYVKHENEIRTGRNVRQLVFRALQIALSDPPGPVYLTGAREAMEEMLPAGGPDEAARWAHFAPIAPAALAEASVEAIAADLLSARRPLVVTSFVGRSTAAVATLTRLARRLGIGVLESVPSRFNFPADDPLYQGNHWNHPFQNPSLADADVVLVLDSDVPWIPTVSRPAADARIHHIDLDPLKSQMPLWHIPASGVYRADAAVALAQLERRLADAPIDDALVAARTAHWSRRHDERETRLREHETAGDVLTPEYLVACVREHLDDRSLVLNEGITNYATVLDHLRPGRPGSVLASGGGSLGWHGGAAIGAKLADPDATVVALTGDGSYMFSVPSTVHWMARHYATPFVTVVFNNRGWKAPRLSMLALHPSGHASRANDIGVNFDPPPDYAGIAAAAGGALALTVKRRAELEPALAAAFHAVREERRCAVVDAWLPQT